jgi:hypothetical protein
MLRTRESLVVPLAAATAILSARSARAQLDLPPPPPPPLAQPNDVPSLPPPPAPPPPERPAEPPRHATSPTRSPRSRVPAAAHAEVRPPPPPPPAPEPPPHPIAVTWNPAGFAWGRLSANVEAKVAAHHAVIASLNALVFNVDRGSSRDVLSEGFGFASPTSLSFGGELGYHYWLHGLPSLSGPFLGPSLVFGATTNPTVGSAHVQGYWGLALDAGIQEVVLGGLTVGGGGGIELLDMASVTAFVPRFLAQVGWSF